MTPKEKAQSLFDKYYIICQEFTEEIQCTIQSKQCALTAVDEIYSNNTDDKNDFWIEVRNEINKL